MTKKEFTKFLQTEKPMTAPNSETAKLTFDALVAYYKAEGQEELAYLTILFTVIIGIIGYLGSAEQVARSARLLILGFYMGLHFTMVLSFMKSIEVHSAIHEEIAAYAKANKDKFYGGEESHLYKRLIKLHAHPTLWMQVGGAGLLVFAILAILSVGNNRFLHWQWLEKTLHTEPAENPTKSGP